MVNRDRRVAEYIVIEGIRAGVGPCVRVEGQGSDENDGNDRPRDACNPAAAWPEEPKLSPQARQQADDAGGDGEGADGRRADGRRQQVAPDQVAQDAGQCPGERAGEDTDQDRAYRVKVDGELEPLLDRGPEDDVDRDRDRHQHDDSGGELASDPTRQQIHLSWTPLRNAARSDERVPRGDSLAGLAVARQP